MAKQSNKKPKVAASVFGPVDKSPRPGPASIPPSGTPRWRFRRLDVDGPWCPFKGSPSLLRQVIARLRDFESMTWAEILGKHHHEIPVEDLNRHNS